MTLKRTDVTVSTADGDGEEEVDSDSSSDAEAIGDDVSGDRPEELPEMLQKVFERFEQLERARGQGKQGAGDLGGDWEEMQGGAGGGDSGAAEISAAAEERVRKLGVGNAKDDNDEDVFEDEIGTRKGLSKKKVKQITRPKISQLKLLCSRPEVVESWDVTAPDPYTLVFLKAHRNTVPVPNHWSHKRKYLQGKRGIEKALFKLPPHIEGTRIAEIRSAIEQKDAQKTLKQKQREKVRPRHQKMNINYEVLHDAFFKYATKPNFTKFGEVYFEGRETELQMRRYSPGKLSERAKEALGMMGPLSPVPWLLNLQRYGPPPSYPNLAIPGVNAHVPEGASLGFQPGGWGKPPTLEQLRQWGVTPRFDEKPSLSAFHQQSSVDHHHHEDASGAGPQGSSSALHLGRGAMMGGPTHGGGGVFGSSAGNILAGDAGLDGSFYGLGGTAPGKALWGQMKALEVPEEEEEDLTEEKDDDAMTTDETAAEESVIGGDDESMLASGTETQTSIDPSGLSSVMMLHEL